MYLQRILVFIRMCFFLEVDLTKICINCPDTVKISNKSTRLAYSAVVRVLVGAKGRRFDYHTVTNVF